MFLHEAGYINKKAENVPDGRVIDVGCVKLFMDFSGSVSNLLKR